jgi:hypothetical protein
VTQVVKLAAAHGISFASVIGDEQLKMFFADGVRTTIHTSRDLETFDPSNILRLVRYFSTRLSTETFWPE